MLYTHNQTRLYGRGYVYRKVKPLKNKYSFQNIYYYDYHRPLVVWLSFVLSILSDIYNANFIGYKIDEYIKNTEYEDDLKQYYNKVYSLQDTTYQELPEDISSHIDYLLELQYAHSGELYTTIQYKMNGATGYAFLIDETNKVHIYISNENKLDEWEIYPETCEEYEFD